MANKYLIFRTEEYGESPLLFEQLIEHKEMAKIIKGSYPEAVIVSAGFWDTNKDGVYKPYGESISLNISSRKEDEIILNMRFNNCQF